jgi:hypothetical protein
MYTSSGILRVDPVASSGLPIGKWWLILQCDAEIGRYYREMFYAWNRARGRLQRPAWESHISVIRGEEPPKPDGWSALEGRLVEFRYSPELQTNDEYFWLDVECDELLDIREQLGLPRNPLFDLHLTIGRVT